MSDQEQVATMTGELDDISECLREIVSILKGGAMWNDANGRCVECDTAFDGDGNTIDHAEDCRLVAALSKAERLLDLP